MMSSLEREYLQSPDYRSTKGASKQRRENINLEIDRLRDLLPLSESSRMRLSQLQIMVLSKTYIEMANSFTNTLNQRVFDEMFDREMIKALPGFLILLSSRGTILYMSDNSPDYIGHSLVDVVSQCESIYEHMHEEDLPRFKSFLSSANQAASYLPTANQKTYMSVVNEGKLSVTFRFGLMKHIRRNRNFDRYKVLRMSGCFMTTENGTRLFAGMCTPQFETMLAQLNFDTELFVTTHNLDMSLVGVDDNGEHYLNRSKYELAGKSLYDLVHPRDAQIFATKHKELLRTRTMASVNARLLPSNGDWLNVHTVLKFAEDGSAGPLIVSYHRIVNPVVGEVEREVTADGVGYQVEPKKESEVDCKLDRADILRRLKNKMDSKMNNVAKRKAATFDPPAYSAAIAPKILKMRNAQPAQPDQTYMVELIMQNSPVSVASDYQAVTSLSETEDHYQEDLSFHPSTAYDDKMPFLDQSDIENFFQNLDKKAELLQLQEFESDAFSSWDWLNNGFVQKSNFLDNLVPAIF